MFDFERFFAVPETFEAEGFQAAETGVKSVFLAGPDYNGEPTRIFAWYGVPEDASKENPVPGIVLVHGGLGTAYAPWVKMWNDRGFAAIAIDMFGGVPGKDGSLKSNASPESERHAFSGPGHLDQFAKVDEAPENQWPYHAVAAIITANSYLASLEGVAAGRIGITGISWGGFATALTVCFDTRFKFAVPVYGCGGFASLKLVPETTPMKNLRKWVSLWDPDNYLPNAKLPILWINGTADASFDIFSWNRSTKLSAKQTCRALRINMPHGQLEGMNAPEILPFAKSAVSGTEYPSFTKIRLDDEGERLGAKWNSPAKIKNAQLIATRAAECWNDCLFRCYPAKLNRENGTVVGTLPAGWTAAYLNLEDENGCMYSSEVFFS